MKRENQDDQLTGTQQPEPNVRRRRVSVRRVMLAAVNIHGCALRDAPDELRSDREIVLAAVNAHGDALEYASQELRSDPEIVLAAVNNEGRALQHASQELRSDREIVLAAVNKDGCALKYASQELRSDREFVLDAVNNNAYFLHYASQELRSDREIVLAAVNKSGYALEHASAELRSDPEVILSAAKTRIIVLKFAMRDQLFSCTTGESIEFMESLLQTLLENGKTKTLPAWCMDDFLPELKEVLYDLSQKLKRVDDFRFRCDVVPDVQAQKWIARLVETQWCLARASQNTVVPVDVRQKIEQFADIARDSQIARELLKYSRIIYLLKKLFPSYNFP